MSERGHLPACIRPSMFRKNEQTSFGVPIEAEMARAAGTESRAPVRSAMAPQNSLNTPLTFIASRISSGCWVPWAATQKPSS